MPVYVVVMYVLLGLAGLVMIAVVGSAVAEWMKPKHKRLAEARRRLLGTETPTGTTSTTVPLGLSEDDVKSIAESERFQWVGYSGRNDRRLNFRRAVVAADETPIDDAGAGEAGLLAALRVVQPDINGVARVDADVIAERMTQDEYRTAAASEGWVPAGREQQGDTTYLLFRRFDSTAVPRTGPEFLNGPPLAELRKHPRAKEVAAAVLAETGVDPLSARELEAARAAHVRLRARALRWTAPAVLLGFAALITVLLAFGTVTVLVAAAVAIVVTGCAIPAVRANRARIRAIAPYRHAYERLVSELLS
ncbi:hypothetical protein [Amycolatopsis sp. CA-230715]|uniref:hypothetical protein n=1 Tax=Amycolatopsis sp. CA-230715 TaxID=2745196 RepID=UPI001C02181A|nr:hypothetical protein [Amycolatopsis sp. CA-230715]QWF84222.1 hypothetical protein HUW46_07671 [Amycolatopsis sp. CA-230715]